MTHDYIFGMNHGQCWNCELSFNHKCCAACKKNKWLCDCIFICGNTYPTGQKNKKGEFCQFAKCKYYTNDQNKIVHECKGMVKKHQVILFIDETNTSSFNFDKIQRQKYY